MFSSQYIVWTAAFGRCVENICEKSYSCLKCLVGLDLARVICLTPSYLSALYAKGRKVCGHSRYFAFIFT